SDRRDDGQDLRLRRHHRPSRPSRGHYHRRGPTPAHERQSARPQSRGGDDGGAEDGAARPACQRGARAAQFDEEDATDRGGWRQEWLNSKKRRHRMGGGGGGGGGVWPSHALWGAGAGKAREPRRGDGYPQPLSSRSAICQITSMPGALSLRQGIAAKFSPPYF